MKTTTTNYDLNRMKAAVEGPDSKTALRLSGKMGVHDILNAFSKAYKSLESSEHSGKKLHHIG